MMSLSEEKLQNKQYDDVAYFEPFYLKEFIAGQPKKIF
jgi:tRNA threonylcarbamoyladenosine biosynthesis protein TsaB